MLVALALGAMAVVALVVPRVPPLAQAVGLAPAAPAPVVAPPVTVTAVVVATASCVSADPHDQVVLDVAGVRHQAALDGCGSAPGTPVPVTVPSDGRIAGLVAVAGSGAQTPAATTDLAGDGVSPLVARLELVLAVAAALGAGSLLVVVARGGAARTAGGARRRAAAGRRVGTGRVPAQRSRSAAGPARRIHRARDSSAAASDGRRAPRARRRPARPRALRHLRRRPSRARRAAAAPSSPLGSGGEHGRPPPDPRCRPGTPQLPVSTSGAQRHRLTLDNGLRVLLAPDRSNPVVGVAVHVDVGFRSASPRDAPGSRTSSST